MIIVRPSRLDQHKICLRVDTGDDVGPIAGESSGIRQQC